MPRSRVPLVTLLLACAATLPVHGQTPTPVNFGNVELGQVATACFTACFGQNCSAAGTIQTISTGTPFFVRGIRVGADSPNLCNNTPGLTTPATLPLQLAAGQRVVWDVDLVPTQQGFFQRPLTVNGSALFDLRATTVPVTTCNPTTALCLSDDRFKVRMFWRTEFGTRDQAGVPPPRTDDSGLFYFFNANNWEVLLKVLNGCPLNDRFWVFAAATTNVEYTITVTDTDTQQVRTYFNPLGNPAPPIQDTSAFATCP
jgi:hypothetical protein